MFKGDFSFIWWFIQCNLWERATSKTRLEYFVPSSHSTITLNETLKFVRNNSRLPIDSIDDKDMNIADGDSMETEDIPTDVLHQLIRELPDGYRTVFNLYVIDDKSHKEIAQLLGIKENTSASQLHKAKSMLARKIKQYRTINSI